MAKPKTRLQWSKYQNEWIVWFNRPTKYTARPVYEQRWFRDKKAAKKFQRGVQKMWRGK